MERPDDIVEFGGMAAMPFERGERRQPPSRPFWNPPVPSDENPDDSYRRDRGGEVPVTPVYEPGMPVPGPRAPHPEPVQHCQWVF